MKDLKEAYADAVDLVEDFLDIETLEEYLFESLNQDGLIYWGQFENAISDASDNPLQEEELFAESHNIAMDAVDRIEKKYQVIEIDRVKAMQAKIKELEAYIASIPLGGKRENLRGFNSPDNVVVTFKNSKENENN